jgi:zinc dependent phospholipase C
LVRSLCALLSGILALTAVPEAHCYAVLAHQATIDVVWQSDLKPLIRHKYPKATEQELDAAEAYAYGGAIIQDLGYYPHGSPFFSDLTHYVRSGDFVQALLNDSQDVYEYAFAVGALSHYATDMDGHPIATNRSVPILYPKLRRKYGDVVTYEDDPLAHVKTEFGFDVLEVARGHYAPEEYHDFIGFEISQRLLEQAFQDTYVLKLRDVMPDEERVLNSYRHDVSTLIPKATRIAWSLKSDDIMAAEPSATHRRFLYNLSRTQYEKEWGKNYDRPSPMEKFLAFLYKLLPKIGPLKVLQLRTPTPQTEKYFEASFNTAVSRYEKLLAQVAQGQPDLPNANFDVGRITEPGQYRLADRAQTRLLDQLAKQKYRGVTAEIRNEILQYFSDPNASFEAKKNQKRWAQVHEQLEQLRNFQPETGSRLIR